MQRTQPLTVIEKNTASILAINSGGDGSKRNFGSFVLQPGLGKRKKFDLVLHTRLMKTFPDWEARMNYQKKQEEFYKSAIKKQTQLKRLRITDTSGFYTKEQDPNMKPNIFDTRQSFLIKMHNPVMRKNFRKSLLDEANSF